MTNNYSSSLYVRQIDTRVVFLDGKCRRSHQGGRHRAATVAETLQGADISLGGILVRDNTEQVKRTNSTDNEQGTRWRATVLAHNQSSV
jgi:hypothetical protein